MARKYSVAGAIGDTLTIENIDHNFPRHTVVLAFFSDATYDTPVTSGVTGTFAVEAIASGGQTYTSFDSSPIDASVSGSIASAASPVDTLRVTPTTPAGATHYNVTLTSNKS